MKTINSTQRIILMFNIVEEYLSGQQLDLALSQARTILLTDTKNFYARTIERRLERIISERTTSLIKSDSGNNTINNAISALKYICQLAIKKIENVTDQAFIHNMNQQMRVKALEEKYISLFHQARQLYHMQEYERALSESKRALIIKPNSQDAIELIEKIKLHIASLSEKGIPDTPVRKRKKEQIASSSQKAQKRPIQKNQTGQLNVSSDKILSCIAFAEYHRTNMEYNSSLSFIEKGLELDKDNEILLQMKIEVEQFASKKGQEILSAFSQPA